VCAHRRPPAARGLPSTFIVQGEAAYNHAALFYSTCGGMVYNAMERMVVLANLASGETSQRVMYSSRSGFEGGTVETSCLVVVCDNPPRKIPYYRLRPIHFGH
jgi:hypothetical protein